ncbi:MAG TPA: hypothetical protein VFE31_11200 [Opitutaceae bacterium]|jgi:hypothetical protein|nr:hypothetical protein [Opitutaceae bacterium]
MEQLNLEPLATACAVTGEPFAAGDRVVSFLMRGPKLEALRADVRADQADAYRPPAAVACRWVQVYKPRAPGENADRALKLTAESLFFTLVDPLTEPSAENTRLIQFLGLLLERKRVLKPRGRTRDGARTVYEHARTKQTFEIASDELTPAFFLQIQEQLGVLVGEPKPKAAPAAPAPA